MTRTTQARWIAVAITLLGMFAAALGAPAPASAAPPLSCWSTPNTPYSSNSGMSIDFSGQIECNRSVAWIDITVTLLRDGFPVDSAHYTARRLPHNGLLRSALYRTTSCQTSGFYT